MLSCHLYIRSKQKRGPDVYSLLHQKNLHTAEARKHKPAKEIHPEQQKFNDKDRTSCPISLKPNLSTYFEEMEKLKNTGSSPLLRPDDAIALLEASLSIRITASKLSRPTTMPCFNKNKHMNYESVVLLHKYKYSKTVIITQQYIKTS